MRGEHFEVTVERGEDTPFTAFSWTKIYPVSDKLPNSHHISTILPVFNLAWDSHGWYFPECCWSFNRGDWGVFSISPVQIINQIFGIILIFDNDTTVKRIIEIGNDQ